ncbi:hypothetical protein [Mycobacterium sp. E2238]|uniref:ApeA N-terminal domain 1-containing protein n=1 Tax=Mycobacterium sp. E2238 TaxID=1834131 RepID=UPI0007FF3A59|nr:hypothetical protein [Mycobacterium sp. E2238]OBI28134.1 hypothetical protein A5711_02185 [Mycobacterium sp. E2238]
MSSDDMDNATPYGAVKPGNYECTWNIGGRTVQGAIELTGGRFPHGTARFTLPSCAIPDGWAFPGHEQWDRVTGYIDAVARAVVLIGVTVSTIWENVTHLDADYALVGDGLSNDDDLVFQEVRFQTTGLELIAGFTPLTQVAFPAGYDERVMEWSAKCEGGTSREWSDEGLSVALDFSSSATVSDAYRFGVRFACWATIKSREGRTVREWYRGRCGDLLTLVSAATGRAESLTHMHFMRNGTTVTVFTRGITQSPYYARQDRRTQVCYRVGAEGGASLLDVLRRVEDRREEGHPMIDGYDPVVLSRAQHPRSRVLQLVQWIEASHGFETRDTWERRAAEHTAAREDLVAALTAARKNGVLTAKQLRFAKSALSKHPFSSLDEALRAVLDRHPTIEIRRRLGDLPLIQAQLALDDCDSVENAIRLIRNGLSHGTAEYDAGGLDRLAGVLRHLVRADYLRVLGCDYEPEMIFEPGE